MNKTIISYNSFGFLRDTVKLHEQISLFVNKS